MVLSTISFGQNLDDLDSYLVDEFYKKVELDYGTLDEDGDEIEYVYVKTEINKGDYKIDLTDGYIEAEDIYGFFSRVNF